MKFVIPPTCICVRFCSLLSLHFRNKKKIETRTFRQKFEEAIKLKKFPRPHAEHRAPWSSCNIPQQFIH